ncbi:PhoX family protein [Quadrisphaera setariae]|uniref:PhoX family phosphatase n=1 Tax=Quadrisphaera setariae TaxID=2593304 RepID=A0A5C8ZKT5_9ACTN|nr:PhoX family phosphatase [Quadrisphaera setariae]TXR57763.1 PhoX family phosphatase [Quadrisphaera setariae]
MSLSPTRALLPMAGHTRGTRSAATCHFKCGDACLTDERSASASPSFASVVEASLSRRNLLLGLGAVAAAAGTGALTVQPAEATPATPGKPGAPGRGAGAVGPKGLAFAPIAPVPSTTDQLTVPAGYAWKPLISWGDPVVQGAPPFDLDRQSAEAQEKQFGYNCDYLAILPQGRHKALLVSNHEYTNENLMVPGFTTEAALTVEQLRTSIAAHGLSVVQLRRGKDGFWEVEPSKYGRRFTGLSTRFELRGPVAGTDLVKTAKDPGGRTVIGTLNNCAGGTTPWGTVLSGEENFDQYFRGHPQGDQRNQKTYSLVKDGKPSEGRYWHKADARFDTAREPHEINRFGWIVEVDPRDPRSTPVKHTALGRFKHEGATTLVATKGNVVAYMGDDSRGQHLYKFVSRERVGKGGKGGRSELLDAGDLYVAKFEADGDPATDRDGTGTWIPLTKDGKSAVPGMSHEEVLVFTRDAAAKVGATPMDRPEDVEPDPRTGYVYVACTNNTDRTSPAPANPRAKNKDGHVIELREAGGDATGTRFDWSLLLVCGDPEDPSTYFSGFPAEKVSPISCPDNVAFDKDQPGLWISTDGAPSTLKLNDALHFVPLTGADRGRVSQFLAVPTGAETCGPWIDAADGSVFVNVQHPGETDTARVDAPASAFPYTDASKRTPRPSTVQVRRTGK